LGSIFHLWNSLETTNVSTRAPTSPAGKGGQKQKQRIKLDVATQLVKSASCQSVQNATRAFHIPQGASYGAHPSAGLVPAAPPWGDGIHACHVAHATICSDVLLFGYFDVFLRRHSDLEGDVRVVWLAVREYVPTDSTQKARATANPAFS
jgi:hypothetical protein